MKLWSALGRRADDVQDYENHAAMANYSEATRLAIRDARKALVRAMGAVMDEDGVSDGVGTGIR